MIATHSRIHRLGWPSLLSLALLLAACDPSSGSSRTPLPNTTLNLDFKQTKQFLFDWAPVEGAGYYQLKENPDGQSGFEVVADNITTHHYSLTVPLYARTKARYLLNACDDQGCNAVAETQVAVKDVARLIDAVGYFKASDPEEFRDDDGNFGKAISLSGDGNTLAVGAEFGSAQNRGLVYLFNRDAAGQWSIEDQPLTTNDTNNVYFGIYTLSLSQDGNTLAVGAQDHETEDLSGAVYLFERTDGQWQAPSKLKSASPQKYENFGASSGLSLSADGKTLAVGAIGKNSSSGVVYTWQRSERSETWSPAQTLTATQPETGAFFGRSVSLNQDGTQLAVGADRESVAGLDEAGAAYVFNRTSVQDDWNSPSRLTAINPGEDDEFGLSLSLSADGTTLAVSSQFEDTDTQNIVNDTINTSIPDNEIATNSGAVYVFQRNDAQQWPLQAYIKASNAQADDEFGDAVSLSATGNHLAIGASSEKSIATGINGDLGNNNAQDEPGADIGAAYVFVRRGDGQWHQQAYLKPNNTQYRYENIIAFGKSLSFSADGNTLAVGIPYESINASGVNGDQNGEELSGSGAVYLY